MVFFLQEKKDQPVLARVLWLVPFKAENPAHGVDTVSKLPLYVRRTEDVEDLPPLIPIEVITGFEHFIHACHHPLYKDQPCLTVGGITKHNLTVNNLFVAVKRVPGRN